ncbi:hypothetical protein N7490_005213 [Penicillium lividum]|nr:hypothetical protein N7490_005213 [Penicillium lividum]
MEEDKDKARPDARQMQTPAPDGESAEFPGSPTAKSSLSQAPRHKENSPDQHIRFEKTSTQPGDFAPNAGDYGSNEEADSDGSEASDPGSPMEEDEPDPLSEWVIDVIKNSTSNHKDVMWNFFDSNSPNYEDCSQYFQRLNQEIRAANKDNNVDLDIGVIPEGVYSALCESWEQEATAAKEKGSPDEFWEAFDKTRDILKKFNERHHLPRSWNISEGRAQRLIGGKKPAVERTMTYDRGKRRTGSGNRSFVQAESSMESDGDIDGNEPTGFDALEARTIEQQRRLGSAKVLYWWPKGTGSQIFVRYGDRSTPIYRIRAGSHETYNPSTVERVLTSKTRGTAKRVTMKDGIPDECWKYTRRDVKDLIGIGWKVEDDDESGLNPLNLLQPAKGSVYPQTRALVKWKDDTFTLEGRSFIRRITTGSALDGDRLIWQKAEELESSYRKKHGIEIFRDDNEDESSDEESDEEIDEESDSYIRPKHRRQGRKYREAPHYTRSHHSAMKDHRKDYRRSNRKATEDSDAESVTSTQYKSSQRYNSKPAAYRTSTHKSSGKIKDSAAKIEELEHQIRQLRVESSKSPRQGDNRRRRVS